MADRGDNGSCASTIASARVDTPRRRNISETWALTVLGDSSRSLAICLLDFHRISKASTRNCLVVSTTCGAVAGA